MRAVACLACLAFPILASAQAPRRGAPPDQQVVEVGLGASTFVELSGSRGKVTLTDPSVAEITPAGGGLLVVGRKVGETNLILYGGGDRETYLIKVSLPAQAIQSEIRRLFPRQEIEARAVGGSLVLVGVVDDVPVVKQAEELALGYLRSPSIAALDVTPHVINLLRVRGRQQVQLEVKFAEVTRRSTRAMGLEGLGAHESGNFAAGVGRAGQRSTTDANGRGFRAGNLEDDTFGAIFVGIADGKFPFAATLNLLARNGLARTLAEPNLVAMSGQSANFLAGGEVPILIPSSFGGVQVEYKEFGIGLEFMPTVMADRTIQLTTRVAISAIDPTVQVVLQGFELPGFSRREGGTVLRLRDGQSFAMAGLLADEMSNSVERIPGLGQIPILGALFSSKRFERKETELIVVVTAHLVDPMDAADVPPLPGEDRVSDPSDLEFFLLHITEPTTRRRPARSRPRAAAPARRPVGALGFWR